MKVKIGKAIFEIVKGDITKQKVEAIVNAANPRLSLGGGVSGAIHRAAGAELWKECKKLGGCKTGEAKITGGYNLAKYVIHTVGPVYKGRKEDEKLLESCYKNSMKLAIEKGIKSIAFPAISTGIYGYPVEKAAEIAIKTLIDFLKKNEGIELVRLVLYDDRAYEVHAEVMKRLFNSLTSEDIPE